MAAALLAQETDVNGSLNVKGTLRATGPAGALDMSAANATRPLREVLTAPTGACTLADGLRLLSTTGLIYGCPSNTLVWTIVGGVSGVASLGGLTGALSMSTPLPDNAIAFPNFGSGANALRLYFPLASQNGSATGGLLSGAEYAALAAKAQTGAACPAGQHISQISAGAAPTCTADTGASVLPCEATIATNQLQVSSPCAWKLGENSVAGSAAVITATGSGAIYVHGGATGIVVYGSGSAVPTCVSGCTASGTVVTGYQAGLVPLWSATVTSGTLSAATSGRQPLSAQAVASIDPNITATTGVDGSKEIALASTLSFVSRTTAPIQTGTNASRPTTCIVGQLYYQTDSTVGLFRHDGAAGSCSWQAVGGGAQKTRLTIPVVTERVPGSAVEPAPGINAPTPATGMNYSYLGDQPVIIYADGFVSAKIEFDVYLGDWQGGSLNLGIETLTAGGTILAGQVARFQVATVCIGDGDNANTPTYNTTQNFDLNHPTVNGSFIFRTYGQLALTTTGCTNAKTMRVQFWADRTADTHGANIALRRIEVRE